MQSKANLCNQQIHKHAKKQANTKTNATYEEAKKRRSDEQQNDRLKETPRTKHKHSLTHGQASSAGCAVAFARVFVCLLLCVFPCVCLLPCFAAWSFVLTVRGLCVFVLLGAKNEEANQTGKRASNNERQKKAQAQTHRLVSRTKPKAQANRTVTSAELNAIT